MKLHGSALRLTIFIDDTDLWHHRLVRYSGQASDRPREDRRR